MEKILEYAEPIIYVLIVLVSDLLVYVWEKNKAKAKDVAMDAVAVAEKHFSGMHDKGAAKLDLALSKLEANFPFLPKKVLTMLIEGTLKHMQEYAAAEVGKALDEVDKGIMGGGYREEISD